MALLRAVCKGKSARDLAMIELMVKTGLRVSERVALKVTDVELGVRAGRVIVRKGQGGKYREMPDLYQTRTGRFGEGSQKGGWRTAGLNVV
jgi:site-specific recombinase XerD